MEALPRKGLFVLDGNRTKEMFRIPPADRAFTDNLICFTWIINTKFKYWGIFNTDKAAEETILVIRERLRDQSGNHLF